MLPDGVKALVRDEQSRQDGQFVSAAVGLEGYLAKLDAHAEVLADLDRGRCRGAVVFYANDLVSRCAYITLVVVDPHDRGSGLGHALMACVLTMLVRRGFRRCRLEVQVANAPARRLYAGHGFAVIEDRGDRHLMERVLA